MTNADKIRAMTDEEMAALLADKACPAKSVKKRIDRCVEFYPSCGSCWLDLLKQEAEE